MEVARSLDQRPTEEALLLSHERSFSHFVSRLLVSFPAAITSRRSKKSRETFAREFANFSTRSVARNDGARIIRAAISQSSRTRRSERLDARLISAIGGKSNEIYIVDTNQLASVHGSRGHESSVTSQPFRRSRRARNAGNQWCNPTALSLSLSPRTADSIAENWRGWVVRSKTLIIPIPVISPRLIGSFEKHPPSPTADSREWLFSLQRMLGRKKEGREEKGMEEWGAQLANYSKRVDPFPFRAYRYRSSVIRGGALYRPLSVSQPRCTVGWCDDAIFVQMNNTPLGWFIVSRLKDTLSWPITPVDNRWRTRRSKEVSFRRIRASSPHSKPNHPDELCDFSSISGVSRLPRDINCAFSLRRGGGKKLTITRSRFSTLSARS